MPDDEQPHDRGPEPTQWGIVIALVTLASALTLEIALIATIDQRHEALRQVVDIGDERDAHHQRVKHVLDPRPQPRFKDKSEQKDWSRE
jgi:hypothetical protein